MRVLCPVPLTVRGMATELGCVRVQFCKVVKWMKPLHHASTARRASLPGAAAELCDRKGARVVAKAGTATEKDHDKETSAREAVLSGKILHECRVFFNDFGGYRAQATMGAAMLEPLTFRGLPLSALRQSDVRRRCLETFLRARQRDGSEKESEKRISGWGFGLLRASTRGSTEDQNNAKVQVMRVAKFACEFLSPAAAKIVCAGAEDEEDALYQTHAGLTDKERFAHLDENTTALGEYFVNRPDLYEVTSTKAKGWLTTKSEYAVAFAELVID